MVLSIHFLAAQNLCTHQFKGKVTDQNGQELIGASVIMNPGTGQVTDINGNFHFQNLCSRKYHIEVRYLGYTDVQFDINVDNDLERNIQMNSEAKQLEEIVVHDEAEHVENAVNYVELNQKKLGELAGKSLGETLTELPGVTTIQTGPMIFKPVIHGVHSQRILILNHGIRQEGQQWGAEHAPEIDPFIAYNMVVIKDAAAIKYGSDALGGVILVNPPPLPTASGIGGSVNTVMTSNGRSGALSAMLEGGINNHTGWGWRLQGTAKRGGDYHSATYQLTNTGVQELDFSTAAGYHDNARGIEIFFSHFETSLGILKGTAIGNSEDLEDAMEREPPQNTKPFSYTIEEPRQEVAHNLLKINAHQQGEVGGWRLQYGFQNNSRREYDIRRGALSSIPSIDLKLNTHTLDLEWERGHGQTPHLSFGANSMYQLNSNIFGTQRIPFIPNYTAVTFGLFGVYKFTVGNWSADLGSRYDYRNYSVRGYDFKNAFFSGAYQFNNASATLGVSRQWNGNQTLSTSVSTAWRPPHVAELYSVGTHQSAAAIEYGFLLNDSTNEVRDINERPFHTEQALKWVSTYKRKWNAVEIEASVYANYIFNYIYLRAGGITQTLRGTYPYFRYDQTDALYTGFDFEGIWQLASHVKLEGRMMLLKATDVKHNDYFNFIPSNKYTLGLNWEDHDWLGLNRVYAEAKLKYVDKQHFAPMVVSVKEFNEARVSGINLLEGNDRNFDFMAVPDAYLITNAAVGFSTGNKVRYDVRVSVENLFNTSYREYTNRLRYYANDLGRNFILSVKCIF